jgi:hypothetical protein
LRGRHLAGRILEAAVRGDLSLRQVETDRGAALAEFDGERKSHVPRPTTATTG